jgi:uncharacterized protein YbaP (TraB family)
MKQLNYILVFLVGFFFQLSLAQPTENSLLWKVSGNGLTSESYLFGTLHATCDATLSDKVVDAFHQTEQLALELDMSDQGLQMKMAQQMYIPGGKSIQDFMTEEEFETLSKNLEGKLMGMNLAMLQNVKPLFINMMLIPAILECPQQAFDLSLLQLAQAEEMPIIGLEEVEDQMKALSAISIEDQVKELLEASENNLEKSKKELLTMLALYDNEDILGLEKFMKENESSLTANTEDLLDKRNESWIPVIEKMMKEKPSFFGFGALHLVGEKGVIQLLRNQGYQVEAIR